MPDKKDIIIIALGCIIALGLGYWVGKPKKGIDNTAKPSKRAPKTINTFQKPLIRPKSNQESR